jgi:hypothetical protein
MLGVRRAVDVHQGRRSRRALRGLVAGVRIALSGTVGNAVDQLGSLSDSLGRGCPSAVRNQDQDEAFTGFDRTGYDG